MTGDIRGRLTPCRLRPAILGMAVTLCWVNPAAGQYPAAGVAPGQASTLTGSVPSGPASNEVLRLTLRDAITCRLRHNLARIETGENARVARGQRLLAEQNVDLANENLARSKDRFTSGVTDSVEVVQAEQSLAIANDQYIASLYNHSFAKLSLARALGVARTSTNSTLGGR